MLLAEKVDAAYNGVFVDLAMDVSFDPILIGRHGRDECQLKVALAFAGQVESGILIIVPSVCTSAQA